ncbi:citrate/tricarballylate utilization protein [Mycoplana sp. BE70]|uniref:tricarballylate utilization 4Fe-4S protein TcuB n=1 Tax=Mycoplana sp. BE70 TaxID=2817775 RepID=UPI002857DC51|nr:tricarballylate utilization 4Fe-4S protein TcuB [Mycoplana sp. BE70]MDR6758070.1 citrate/tricarballylate utilization protein [Mycoplana sp. BE70]
MAVIDNLMDLAGKAERELDANVAEVDRILHICNACRYCESFCAVFSAMTRRLDFNVADAHYMANLCHNCSACLYACQYAPPHEFGVNLPKTLSRVRRDTYMEYAFPRAFGELYRQNGLAVAMAVSLGVALFLIATILSQGSLFIDGLEADFYAIFPHNVLAVTFGAAFGWSAIALAVGVSRFWRQVSEPGHSVLVPDAIGAAAKSALTLKYLGGGHGDGCNNEDDAFTLWRRRFHHLTFYGFMLCFASTSVATLYHYLWGVEAPYPVFSLPVLLGTAGGMGLIIGPAGLFWLSMRRNDMQIDERQKTMDRGFIALLFFISLTGLALLAWRESTWMPFLLAIHLGFVMGLFLTLPYGKFAHGIFRSAALLKHAIEKRKPNPVQAGSE